MTNIKNKTKVLGRMYRGQDVSERILRSRGTLGPKGTKLGDKVS